MERLVSAANFKGNNFNVCLGVNARFPADTEFSPANVHVREDLMDMHSVVVSELNNVPATRASVPTGRIGKNGEHRPLLQGKQLHILLGDFAPFPAVTA